MYDDHIVRRMIEGSKTDPEAPKQFFGDDMMKDLEKLNLSSKHGGMPKILVLGQDIPLHPSMVIALMKSHTELAESVKHMTDCKNCGPVLTPGQRVLLQQVAALLDMSEYIRAMEG